MFRNPYTLIIFYNIIEFDDIINEKQPLIKISEINSHDIVHHTEILLTMFELATKPKIYNYDNSTKTVNFWDNVKNNNSVNNIFANYSAATLKSYWCIITSCDDLNKFVRILIENKELIDNTNSKLKKIIRCISSFIKNNENGFARYFGKYMVKKKKHDKIDFHIPLLIKKRNPTK